MKKFIAEGIRFECQGTGQCCTSRGSHGFVYLSLKDRQRFAKFFKIPTAEFTRKYCEKSDGWFHLRESKDDCRFLDGKRCSVYEARPTQCRTWPFWPEHMSPRAWKREVVSLCPGVGKGRLYSKEEITEIVRQDREIFD